jgi:hypothetical protein
MDWKLEQRLAEREARQAEAAHKRLLEEEEYRQKVAYYERADAFRASTEDFDEVVGAIADMKVPDYIVKAMQGSEYGPQLAYMLAQKPQELHRIARLNPYAAVLELGRLEARFASNSSGSASPVTPSKAPEPIRPVGGGGRTSTKRPEEMTLPEYRRWRESPMARR